jgi:hypothetical protein
VPLWQDAPPAATDDSVAAIALVYSEFIVQARTRR